MGGDGWPPYRQQHGCRQPQRLDFKDRIISLPNGCPPNPERLFEINDGEGREAVLEQLGLWRAAMLRKAEDKRSALRCFRRALDWVKQAQCHSYQGWLARALFALLIRRAKGEKTESASSHWERPFLSRRELALPAALG